MNNGLDETKQQRMIGLGRMGWSIRRIEAATGVRRETIRGHLKTAGIAVRRRNGFRGLLHRLAATPCLPVSLPRGSPARSRAATRQSALGPESTALSHSTPRLATCFDYGSAARRYTLRFHYRRSTAGFGRESRPRESLVQNLSGGS